MNAKENPPTLDDPRVVAALDEYLAALEAGQKPNRQAFLARHADIAEPLAECLEGMEALYVAGSSTGEGSGTNTSTEWQPGTPLGDFRILREIGRGGMGVVYEAQQLSLDRRIALKVLPFALTLDPRQLQRFKTEARAAAHLHHQNIVPIYSVGCERGVHFYAMQFVEGQSLAEVIQELRGDKETRRQGDKETKHLTTTRETDQDEKSAVSLAPCLLGSLSAGPLPDFFRNVAELGVQAAEALEHAHEYGVVHRDVKPGNVLLDAHGHLWIADFGLAQFQSDAVLTLTGDLLGTLRYMSPEQALARRGLVDHRTDLYSLGATLYELLTLQPAYSGRDREELLRQIAFEEPCPPRRVNPAIPADLETILLKAMAKGVEERYATARELRDDLHRFLEHQPIRARRPTLRERAAKWSRRHRGVVVTAVALLLLAAVGLAASTALIAREQWKTQAAYDRLTAEQDRTRAAYEAEAQQRARAEEGFRQARQAVDFLAEMTEEELADRPELQGLRRKLLQAALDYYQDFITQHGDDPSIQAELLASHLRVATILNEIGSRADAQAALARARQVEEKLARENRLPPAFGPGQTWGPGRPGFSRENGAFALLVHRSVQEDLKLSADQVQKVAQLAGKRRDLAWECRDLSPEETRVRFAGQEAQEKALVESLPGTASRRLKQIVWQQRGMLALNDVEVAEALTLSPGQQEKIRALFDETHPSRGGPPGFGGFPPDSRRRAESFVNVLTAAQKARWDELIGEPFKGEIRPSFRGPPGPGRDPPGFGQP